MGEKRGGGEMDGTENSIHIISHVWQIIGEWTYTCKLHIEFNIRIPASNVHPTDTLCIQIQKLNTVIWEIHAVPMLVKYLLFALYGLSTF